MPSKKISTAIAVLTLSLTTACSVFSDDSTPAETTTRTQAVEKAANGPEDNAVILLTSQENDGRITNEDFERLRKNITDAENSEESPQTARELATAQRTKSEDQRWCQAWALDNLQPHIYTEFAQLNPDTMDDLDRTIWRTRLENNSPSVNRPFSTNPVTYDHDYRDSSMDPSNWATMVGTCWMYWSEPLSVDNADRRNVQYEAECKRRLLEGVDPEWGNLAQKTFSGNDPTAYEIPNKHVQVLKWLNMTGHELLKMDEPPYELLASLSTKPWAYGTDVHGAATEDPEFNIRWVGIVGFLLGHRNSHGRPEQCLFYYPQLFYGYWVPFIDPPGNPPDQLSADEVAEVKRITAGPMYLPRP